MQETFGVDSTSDLTGGKGGTASQLITHLQDFAVQRWVATGVAYPPDDFEADVPH